MNYFDNLFLSIHDYTILKKLKKINADREALDYNDVKSIGILFDGTNPENEATVVNFINQVRKKGKKVTLLGYVPTNNQSLNVSFPSFCNKDLDVFRRPNNQKVLDFIAQPFDVVINLTPINNMQLDYIAALTNAKLRVGPYTSRTHCYDLMIDHNEKTNLNSFIKQIDFFLNRLKSSNYEYAAV